MPCEPHKQRGAVCLSCTTFSPVGDELLIIKLGSMGDVLRTAALLPDIVAAYDRPAVTWVTRSESVPLLAKNPYVDRIVPSEKALAALLARSFTAVYTFDADEEAVSLSSLANAEKRFGYRPGSRGLTIGIEPPGDDTLFSIGLSDAAKRANQRTCLDLLAAASALRYGGHRPFLSIDGETRRSVRRELALLPNPTIALNVDASGRWERKTWTVNNVVKLTHRLHSEGFGAVLLGDAQSLAGRSAIAGRYDDAVLAFDSNGDVERLCAAIDAISLLVTPDTLAMHIAWAVGTPVVALFGPTSAPEINLAAEDRKLVADVPCIACYKARCDIEPNCMESISAERVFGAIKSRLEAGRSV